MAVISIDHRVRAHGKRRDSLLVPTQEKKLKAAWFTGSSWEGWRGHGQFNQEWIGESRRREGMQFES